MKTHTDGLLEVKPSQRGRDQIEADMKLLSETYEKDFETAMCNMAALQVEVLLDIRESLIRLGQETKVVSKWGPKL